MSRNSAILGIDFCYAVAVIGTMMAGTLIIIGTKTGLLSHIHYNLFLDFFPSLFFFLNGTTLSLSMRDKRISNRRLLSYMSKRGLFLMGLGTLFITSWPMNLFFACGTFFLIAPLFAGWSNLILRMLIVLFSLFAVVLINSDVKTFPEFGKLELQGAGLSDMAAFVFFNGYYSLLPWGLFFIAGVLYGRGEMKPRGILPPISLIAIAGIVASFFVQKYSLELYNESNPDSVSSVWPLSMKFLLPAFILFVISSLVLFTNTSIYLLRKGLPDSFSRFIRLIAGSKYSIYMFQLVVGFVLVKTFNLNEFRDRSLLLFFAIVTVISSIVIVAFWKKKLDDMAPIERLMKRISGSAKKN
jgi:hypothetical protein